MPNRRSKRGTGIVRAALASAAIALAAAPAGATVPDWWEVAGPSPVPPQVFGGYARGCLAGAEALPADGHGFQVMRPSRNRFYGHPDLIRFIEGLAASLRATGWPGLLVGDLAQARGGPMRTGHASHQTGLDADIWFLPAPARRLARAEREEMGAVSMVREDGMGVDAEHWNDGNTALLRTAARAPEVARIFVHPAIKRHLCETVEGDRGWLGKIRPWWGHDSHFHVRLRCPAGAPACVDQPPPALGDGCDESLAWWFADAERVKLERQRTAPVERRPITLAELPPQCREVLTGP